MSNRPGNVTPGVSTQQEANGRVPLLDEQAALLMGTGGRCRLVLLKPICYAHGEQNANSL